MCEIISVANQKGGVGKTTTAVNIASNLAELGEKVLAIDFDPQGNMTSSLGIDKNSITEGIYEVIINNLNIKNAIIRSNINNLDILASNINLSGAEIELLEFENRDFVLKKHLDKIKNNYDFIIIDCPPSLSLLTINALTSSDSVLIPLQCEYYALEGLAQMLKTISLIQKNFNKHLKIKGIVFTLFDIRNNLSKDVVENVKQNLEEKIYNTVIPRNVRLAEAPSFGMPINLYDPKSLGAISYKELTKEILEGV